MFNRRELLRGSLAATLAALTAPLRALTILTKKDTIDNSLSISWDSQTDVISDFKALRERAERETGWGYFQLKDGSYYPFWETNIDLRR